MPRLPDATALGERPTPQISGRAPSYPGASGAETVPGESLMRLGRAVGNVSNVIHQAMKVEEARTDTIVAEDAFNKLRERQIDLTIGDEKGFVHQKGALVLDGKLYTDYTARFDESVVEVGANLSNDRQRQLFRQRAGMASLQYKENLLQHVMREKESFAKQVFAKGVDIEIRNVALRWQDPNAVAMSLTRVQGLIGAESDRETWSAQEKEAIRADAVSKIHAAVVANALASDDHGYAQQWWKAHNREITGPEAVTIKKALEEGGVRAKSQSEADRIAAEYADPDAAMEAARQIKDPKIRDATEERVRRHNSDTKDFDARRRNALFIEASNTVEQAGDVDQVDPARWAELGPTQRSALRSLAEHVRKGTEPKQDDETWLKFAGMGPGARARIDEADLLQEYRPHLDRQHWEQAMSMWRTARDAAQGKPEAKIAIKDELTFEQRFTDTVKASGLLPKDKTIGAVKGEQAAMMATLRQAAADDILSYKRAAGKDYIPPEEVQRIINKHVLRNVFIEEWGRDPRKPASVLTEKERGKAYVSMDEIPAPSVLAIKKQAERLKVTASTRQIERAYAAALMGASDAYITAILTGRR